jgi:hypothetical protein
MERATALLAGLSAPNVPALPVMVVGAKKLYVIRFAQSFSLAASCGPQYI